MSSTPDGGASPVSPSAVTIAAAGTKTMRRVPPPCWTDEEILALVNAYKEKWFALRRGNLRSADWDAVSVAVSSAGGMTKSSVQCRHKIEKLRKRYRAEKQRLLNRPGKFSSSWDLFPMLDAMDFAPSPAVGSCDPDIDRDDEKNGAFDGFVLKPRNFGNSDGASGSNFNLRLDFGIRTAKRSSREKDFTKMYGDFNSGLDIDHGFGAGFGLKRKYDGNSKCSYDFNGNSGGRFGVSEEDEVMLEPKAVRLKTCGKPFVTDFGHDGGGFPVKTIGHRGLVPPKFKPNSHGKVYGNFSHSPDYDDDIDDMTARGNGFREKISNNWDSVPIKLGAKGYGRTSESYRQNTDSRVYHGFGSASRSGNEKSNGNTAKSQPDMIEEVVSSVKMLTEMFVRVENTKMEMLMEIEKSRMETELKQCQMMLESQQQIVDAFAEALMEKKKSKKKADMVVTASTNGGCDEAN